MGHPPNVKRRGGKSTALRNCKLSGNQDDSRTRELQPQVDELRAMLGDDVVLLWIPPGKKGPTFKQWESTTLEQTRKPDYLAKLNGKNNIGVLLGRGLITIDLDQDTAVEPFLERNPKLRSTLRTKRVRGCNLWARIKGKYPSACKLTTKDGVEWGEWRADGNQTVIYGEAIDRKKGEQKPTAYKIQHPGPLVEIAFEEVQWPDEVVRPWQKEELATRGLSLDALREVYGDPFYLDDEGKPRALNENFWGGLFATENFILWEPDERAFYTYDPETGIYKEESVDAVKRRLSARLLEASRQINNHWLETQRTNRRLKDIVAHLCGIVERRGAFAARERRIHLQNGVFRFQNGGWELVPFSPDIISRNASPILFDENADCPRFLGELVIPAMHEEDVVLLQKYFGLCLLGHNLIQRMLILDGFARRGKTQLANVIQAIVGRLNCTQLRTEWLGDRFETYRFIKKTLLVGVDVAPNFLSTPGASVLKGLVGGDWFDAEQKFGTGSFQFQGNFCVVVTSNTRLRVRLQGDIGAWRRRLLIVRFEAPPPPKDIPDFGEKLVRQEGSGILNWGIIGLALLLKDIDETGNIALSERQLATVDNLLAESDSLRLFLRERVEKAEGADLSVQEIIESYAAFCPERGWNPLPITEVQRSLQGLMLELFHVAQSHSINREERSVRGFRGVRLKPKPEEEE
jgi:phage/plasmid-associated DNA primase